MPPIPSRLPENGDRILFLNDCKVTVAQVVALMMAHRRPGMPRRGEFLVDGKSVRYVREVGGRRLVTFDGKRVTEAAAGRLAKLLASNEDWLYPSGAAKPVPIGRYETDGVVIEARAGTKPRVPTDSRLLGGQKFLDLVDAACRLNGSACPADALLHESRLARLPNVSVAFRRLSLPDSMFGTAIVDPPWPYEKVSHSTSSGYSSEEYEPLGMDELGALDLGRLAKYMFLWTTPPFHASGEAQGLMRRWGYEPITCLYWVKTVSFNPGKEPWFKPAYGVGYWFRGVVEPILVGKRKGVESIRTPWIGLICESARHSRKPDGLHEMVEASFPGDWVELFARRERPGWTCLGNQAPGDGADIRDSLMLQLLLRAN